MSYNESLSPVSSLRASVLKLICGGCRYYPCINSVLIMKTDATLRRERLILPYKVDSWSRSSYCVEKEERHCLNVFSDLLSRVWSIYPHSTLDQKWWLVAQVMTWSRTSGPPDVIGLNSRKFWLARVIALASLANQLIYDNPLWVLFSYGFLVIQIVRKNKVYTRIRRSCY